MEYLHFIPAERIRSYEGAGAWMNRDAAFNPSHIVSVIAYEKGEIVVCIKDGSTFHVLDITVKEFLAEIGVGVRE